ncbi:MAG: hypothetical protein C4527_14130 [Candidatus Omnitrophota bacterium]|nr:MAG: hypothetical protein C4527_14130 [Candidatus Omnitrophota bacterium]
MDVLLYYESYERYSWIRGFSFLCWAPNDLFFQGIFFGRLRFLQVGFASLIATLRPAFPVGESVRLDTILFPRRGILPVP